jgi:hypothetical protein
LNSGIVVVWRWVSMPVLGKRMAACVLVTTVVWAGCGTTVIENIVNNGPDASGVPINGGPASEAGAILDATVDDARDTPPSADGAISDDAALQDAGTRDGSFVAPSPDAGCPGPDLRCHVDSCPTFVGGTSISGKVYDPAGVNPLPHVFVYVPVDPSVLPAITPGAKSCDSCGTPIGAYVAATVTDATGSFVLKGVPTGKIPVVFQIGKWRRQVPVTTTSCADTPVTAALSRLPRSKSEGDMPQMAMLLGAADNLGCFLPAVGVDRTEFTAPGAGGRVDVYSGSGTTTAPGLTGGTAGDCTTSSCPLWSSRAALERYDLVLLGCEGGEYADTKPAASVQAMHDWLVEGGKVLATHFEYTWFKNGPADFQNVATWLGASSGTGQGTFGINTTFPKGDDFYNGLADAGSLSGGGIALNGVANSVSIADASASVNGWIYGSQRSDARYLTFTTPVGGACGKVAFTDVHYGGTPTGSVPGTCPTSSLLSPVQKALELLFFDLSACVSDDAMPAPPTPPPPSP